MKKIIITVAIVFACILAVVGIIKAQTATITTNTGTSTTTNWDCVKAAVEKREAAVIAAHDKLSADIKIALEKRKTGLTQAWGNPDAKTRRRERLSAWKNYKTEQLAARKSYKETIKAAWQTFYQEGKACRVAVRGVEPSGLDTAVANTGVSAAQNTPTQ